MHRENEPAAMINTPALGLVEGFYGPLWPDTSRERVASTLAEAGYRFYHYMPKADRCIRDDWRLSWSDERAETLQKLSRLCRARGMRFGVGISPIGYGEHQQDRQSLARRLAQIEAIGVDELTVLFDDISDQTANLVDRQVAITELIAESNAASRVFFCPTYYSDDALLDTLFGQRPDHYLEQLGHRLDQSISIWWAGPKICNTQITAQDIAHVADKLRRKPALWDNYPVNDSGVMSNHLHLQPFSGRDPGLADLVVCHASNPALQPLLSLIPLLSLPLVYHDGETANPDKVFLRTATAVAGEALAKQLYRDLSSLQIRGHGQLNKAEIQALKAQYGAFDHPVASELVDWLEQSSLNSDLLAPTSEKR